MVFKIIEKLFSPSVSVIKHLPCALFCWNTKIRWVQLPVYFLLVTTFPFLPCFAYFCHTHTCMYASTHLPYEFSQLSWVCFKHKCTIWGLGSNICVVCILSLLFICFYTLIFMFKLFFFFLQWSPSICLFSFMNLLWRQIREGGWKRRVWYESREKWYGVHEMKF